MKAVVMAGGEGSRLRPVTANRPKPLVPICNRPIMEHILVLLKRHGIEDVVATVHYLADEVRATFGDGSDHGVRMEYSVEDTPLGTAGSVKQAEALLQGGTFVIVSGDALTDCDLTSAIAYHREKGSLATLVLSRVASPLDFGVVITREDGTVERFLEKPSWSEVFSDTVNTGIYILEPEIFQHMEAGGVYDWSADVFPGLLQKGLPVYGYVMEGYWSDIGSLTQYRDAQEHMLSGRVDLPIPGTERTAGVFVGTNCSVEEGAELVPPVCLGSNIKIKRGARIGPYTVIGDNTLIEEDAVVERSVVWDSAYLGPKVGVHSAIVCSRTTIKRDTTINEDAVVGDRCLVDVGCTIRPRVKLWPDKTIERGSTVTMSLVWGNKWRGTLFRELGVAGLSNIELTPDFAVRLGSAFGTCLPARSRVVTSRDSTRSSIMAKRGIISALLSTGCDVLDLRSVAVPIARHYIEASGASGAVHVRKLPGNVRVTLVELFDSRGAYLPRNLERKVETVFFREDFRRADTDDLGVIEYETRAIESYQADFFRHIEPDGEANTRVVVDYGYSSLAGIYPAMLGRLGAESISLNGFSNARMAPRTQEEIAKHVENVRGIVGTLGYDMGLLITEEGERMAVVDDRGRVLAGSALLGAMGLLVGKTQDSASVVLSVTAPNRLERALMDRGVAVLRAKADARALTTTALEQKATFAGDERGGFVFPAMHPGFDAPFSFGRLLSMLNRSGMRLSEIVDELPPFHMAYEQVRCPFDEKGLVMRKLSEEARHGERVELMDGIKIYDRDSWVLVLPDSVEPVFHVHAESEDEAGSSALAREYAQRIEALVASV